jgi:6-phosphogluconolactonase
LVRSIGERRPWRHALWGLVALAAAQTLTPVGAVPVYFGTSQSQGIYVADLDPATGQLSDPVLALAIAKPGFVALHPTRPLLFATVEGEGRDAGAVASMRIDPDGRLSLIGTRPSEGRGPVHLSVDPSGRVLLVANYGNGSVASFQILEDGSLSEARSVHRHTGRAEHPKRQKGPHAHAIVTDPAGTHAYAPDLGTDSVMVYRLDAAGGTLEEGGQVEVEGKAMGPRHLVWASDGSRAYVINELDLSISVFAPGQGPGGLEPIERVAIGPDLPDDEDLTAAEIRLHPTRPFLYASIRDLTGQGRDTISVLERTPAGLRWVATVPAEVAVPRSFNLDPSGHWMLVGGQRSHDLALFAIDPESGIPRFTGKRIPFDGGPISIEFRRDQG